jgi:hypothetical protein
MPHCKAAEALLQQRGGGGVCRKIPHRLRDNIVE